MKAAPKSSRRNYARDFARSTRTWPTKLPTFTFAFHPRIVSLYEQVVRESMGRFAFVVMPTNSMGRVQTTQMLYGLHPPTKTPALAVGWLLMVLPSRFFRPVGETGTMAPVIEKQPLTRYSWAVVVDYGYEVERAMVVSLEQALETLGRIRLRATVVGAIV